MQDRAAALRKRTKTLVSNTLELPETVLDAASRPGSQLPSPMSSIDENVTAIFGDLGAPPAAAPPRHGTARRRSSAAASTKSARKARSSSILTTPDDTPSSASDAQWIDIPLAVALVPPLGSFLTGGDFLRDFLLFVLLFFYLHQLIKLPWELYLASRPRGRRVSDPDMSPDEERLHDLAAAELRTAEFCYLTLSVLTPLLGAALLRYVGTALTGKDYISWFSTGVFVLVTGVRPWRHLTHRLRSRTEDLQDAVYKLRTDTGADIAERMARLEGEIAELKGEVATKGDVRALHAEIDESLDVIDAAVGKQERTLELGKRSTEERFAALEKALREVRDTTSGAWTLASPRSLFEWISPQTTAKPSKPSPAVSPNRTMRRGYRPRLAPVREEDDGSAPIRGRTPVVSQASKTRSAGLGPGLVDMLLFPFNAGRTLLWQLLDFLQRRLV